MRKLIALVITAFIMALVAAGSSVSTLARAAHHGVGYSICGYCEGGGPPNPPGFDCNSSDVGLYVNDGEYWICGPPWIDAGPAG